MNHSLFKYKAGVERNFKHRQKKPEDNSQRGLLPSPLAFSIQKCPIYSTAGSVALKYLVLYETSKLHNIQRIEMGESSRIQFGQKKEVFTNTKALK